MRCTQVEKHLAEYVDDLLAPPRRERVEAHLSACEACRHAVSDARTARGALRSLQAVRPPATFAPRVRSAIRAHASRVLAPPLLNRDLRATLSGVCLMMGLGLLATRYVQPRPYVAPTPVPTVAEVRVAALAVSPRDAHRAMPPLRAGTPRVARPAPRVVSYVSGTARAMSAVTGSLPSRERLLPKPSAAEPSPSPAVGRPIVSPRAVADPGTGPRFVEDTTEAPRLVVLPAAEVPGTAIATTLASPPGGVASAVVSAGPGDAGDTEAVFGFGDLFREDSLPRYADVS
ncbi:MAG: hypothetical protein FJX75_06240 [Armatimonadetes bacterium]|nr:hypothetical protein [Armatimonadota bacterium]